MNTTDHSGPTAAVTGATGAIGQAIAQQLADLNYRVILITRDEKKSREVVEVIQRATGNQAVTYRLTDLSRQQSIADLAASWEKPLDLLINNAAVTPPSRTETPAGIELQFATNVLGYFWTSYYFRNFLRASAPSRIVNVASYWAGGLDLDDLEFKTRPYDNQAAYRQSKQANRMLTPVLAEKYQPDGISVNACHPGDVNSRLSNNLGFGGSQTPADGAQTPVWVATEKSLEGVTGKYFENRRIVADQFVSQKEESRKLFSICQSYTL